MGQMTQDEVNVSLFDEVKTLRKEVQQLKQPRMTNYDPNESISFNTVHFIEVTLQQWDYKNSYIIDVRGNCSGYHNMDCAIASLYVKLFDEEKGCATISLFKNNGEDELMVDEDFDKDGEDWLKELVTKLEIVSLGERDETGT